MLRTSPTQKNPLLTLVIIISHLFWSVQYLRLEAVNKPMGNDEPVWTKYHFLNIGKGTKKLSPVHD